MKTGTLLHGRFFLMFSLFVCVLTSANSFAEETGAFSGVFRTSGASHYANGEINLETWGNSLLMTATLLDFDREYEVEATLEREGQGVYRGSGKIIVRYSPNTGCVHRFGIRLVVSEGQVFIRENTPRHLPWNPNGPCEGAGPYEWYNHPAPYLPVQ